MYVESHSHYRYVFHDQSNCVGLQYSILSSTQPYIVVVAICVGKAQSTQSSQSDKFSRLFHLVIYMLSAVGQNKET